MLRITLASIFVLASGVIASAGQIQVGGVNGLTNSYITGGGCSGSGPCITGSTGGATEQNYDTVLFSGAANNSTAPVPYSTYNQNSAETGTVTDGSVTFSMINDGVSGACQQVQGGSCGATSNNFWQLSQSGSPSIVIPVGVYGVTDVWTMINSELASAVTVPDRDVTLFFNFGTTSNATTTQTVTVKLTNSNAGSTANGQTQNAIDCSPVTAACGGITTPASGPTMSTALISGVTVDSDQVFSSAYNSATGLYSGTSGNFVLNDEGFLFNGISLASLGLGDTNLNTYLVSVTVREAGSIAGASLALSGVTLDTAPEPSTVFLLLTGLGALCFAGLRRSKA